MDAIGCSVLVPSSPTPSSQVHSNKNVSNLLCCGDFDRERLLLSFRLCLSFSLSSGGEFLPLSGCPWQTEDHKSPKSVPLTTQVKAEHRQKRGTRQRYEKRGILKGGRCRTKDHPKEKEEKEKICNE